MPSRTLMWQELWYAESRHQRTHRDPGRALQERAARSRCGPGGAMHSFLSSLVLLPPMLRLELVLIFVLVLSAYRTQPGSALHCCNMGAFRWRHRHELCFGGPRQVFCRAIACNFAFCKEPLECREFVIWIRSGASCSWPSYPSPLSLERISLLGEI